MLGSLSLTRSKAIHKVSPNVSSEVVWVLVLTGRYSSTFPPLPGLHASFRLSNILSRTTKRSIVEPKRPPWKKSAKP